MSGTKDLPAHSKPSIQTITRQDPDLSIVPETPALHAEAIEALFDRTFGPGHFAKTAERLREYSRSIPELNHVALTSSGELVAVCRVWPIWIETGGPALFFGPVAVARSHRGDRLGLTVTKAALAAAKAAGWHLAVLIGHPEYFGEIGFTPVPGQFAFPGPQDQSRVMIQTLAENDKTYSGRVVGWPLPTSDE